MSQCAFETVKELFQAALGNEDVVPGMVIGIHTWGNFANPHPHLHGLLSQGCFDKQGNFYLLPDAFDEEKFELYADLLPGFDFDSSARTSFQLLKLDKIFVTKMLKSPNHGFFLQNICNLHIFT